MIRVAVRVTRADAEIALAELLELVPGGVEEVDHGDTIEYALYGAEGELPSAGELRAAAGDAPPPGPGRAARSCPASRR